MTLEIIGKIDEKLDRLAAGAEVVFCDVLAKAEILEEAIKQDLKAIKSEVEDCLSGRKDCSSPRQQQPDVQS